MLKKAFTIVELVIAIVIIGILAAIVIPKYLDFSYQATVRAEQRVMLEVLGAVNSDYAKNITGGSVQWYQGNPLDLLAQVPQGWYVKNQWYSGDAMYIFCPHCTSTNPDNPGSGAVFVYRRSATTPTYYATLKVGEIRVYRDWHGGIKHFGYSNDRALSNWNP